MVPGLHVAADYVGQEAHIGATATVLTVVVQVAVCLVVLMLAPLVTVVGYETIGHRHMAIVLQDSLAD